MKIYVRFLFLSSLRDLCDTRECYFGSEIHVSYAFNRWWLSLFCDMLKVLNTTIWNIVNNTEIRPGFNMIQTFTEIRDTERKHKENTNHELRLRENKIFISAFFYHEKFAIC